MAEEKVYSPVVVSDQPFPGQQVQQLASNEPISSTSLKGNSVVNPKGGESIPFPHKTIAHETIGSALNTKSKKILQEFEFTQSGAIQIGKYENGVSGEIKISPAGIVGKNTSGLTTFAIDGETGNAVFAGELQTGALVTGNILIQDGGSIQIDDGNDTTYIDAQGLVSTAALVQTGAANASLNQDFTTTSYVDITGSSLTFTITKDRLIFIFATCAMYLVESVGNTADAKITVDVDSSEFGNFLMNSGNDQLLSLHDTVFGFLSTGTHTIKLKGKLPTIYAGAPKLTLQGFTIGYVII